MAVVVGLGGATTGWGADVVVTGGADVVVTGGADVAEWVVVVVEALWAGALW